MVLAGHDVQNIVESNVYNGLKAKLQFNTWKRICATALRSRSVMVEGWNLLT